MRIICATIFIGALALFCNSCTKGAEFRTDATIKDLMDGVVDPNADYIWDSVSSDSSAKGLVLHAPKTDEDWKELRRHAITLMESMNMIQIPERRVARPDEKANDPRVEEPPQVIQTMIDSDRTAWNKNAHDLYDVTALILKAADAKNIDMVLDAGDQIDKACETCHLKYWYPKQTELLEKVKRSGSERKAP